MKYVQRGFTLIELVMVVVLVGILAAVAIPKFVDLKADAALSASKGVAGALASASAINYAANKANSAAYPLVAACTDVPTLLTNTPTANFTVGGTAPACTVSNSDGGGTVSWAMNP